MVAVLEAMIAAFDSTTRLAWATRGPEVALASFSYRELQVTVTFSKVSTSEWQVGFTVQPGAASADELIVGSVRIFSGVFQSVREFLQVRQPERLVFTSKQETLGQLYERYLQRQDTELAQLGYKIVTTRVDPLVEFALEKTTPSAWVSR